jgi:colanic acid/amylovoran biosynthesis protein
MPDQVKPNIGVLGATLETTNMGVGALAAGTIRCLLNGYPQADIRFLDYAKTASVQTLHMQDRHISVPVINIRFSKRIHSPNNIALLLLIAISAKACPWRRLRHRILSRNATLREIQQMDFLVSIAGGDSFSDIYGIERLLYVSLPQILVLLLGKRLILLPQTLGPFRRRLSKMVARYIVSRADRVYSRDYLGREEMKALLGGGRSTSKFAFCYDVGFVLDPIAPDHIDIVGSTAPENRIRPLAGLNVSGLLFMGGYKGKNMFGLRADYKELVSTIIEFLIEKKDADVLLVPHVFGTNANSEADTVACEKIYGQLKTKFPGRLGLLRGQYNQNQIKYVIGRCDFFVGSRMHACIAAVSQSVPAVCVAYSEKFIGVMETIGIESIVADARMLDVDGILGTIERTFDQREAIHKQLDQKMPEVRETVLNLFARFDEPSPKTDRRQQDVLHTGKVA